MSRYIHKSHNVSVLLYHLVFPAKYRRAVVDAAVDRALKEVCLEIEARYQVKFLEIGTDKDHVPFLVQSVPTYSATRLVTSIKSLTARAIAFEGGLRGRRGSGSSWRHRWRRRTVPWRSSRRCSGRWTTRARATPSATRCSRSC